MPEPVYRQSDFMLYATLKNKNYGSEASWVATTHDTTHDGEQEDKLIVFCEVERSRQEMMDFLGLVNRRHFGEKYATCEKTEDLRKRIRREYDYVMSVYKNL